MTQAAEYFFWLLVGLVASQAFLVGGFCLALSRFRRRLLPDDACPRAAVVLCLRGSDPFLPRCLLAILEQDYPRFELRIIVDHPDDPAAALVRETLARCPGAHAVVRHLSPPLATCSLKCSSLVQAVTDCDPSVAIVAQLDADTIPHRTWLRELATALEDERVGAATGNRWYMPQHATWGSLVRYAWNSAAVVQMYWYRIAWGGTLAIKTSVIRELGLLDRWRRAFCEDTMLFRLLGERGWRVEFVPSLMMINRETCDVGGFRRWVERQLLTARLYHPRWAAVAGHGLGTTLALLIGLILLLVTAAQGDVRAVVWIAAGLAGYELSMFALLLPMEWLVRRIATARGEPTNWLQPSDWLRYAIAVPLTQLIYPRALAAAMRLRRVDWRGVSYQIAGPWDIQLVEYRPYDTADGESASPVSL